MDDYYTLLGVDPDAATDEIRTAYREKKAALTTKSPDSGKASAARLNKAWNVLSDPYQRGRYDEQRSTSDENGEVDDEADDGAVTTPRQPVRSRQQARTRQARELPPPTIELPPGTSWPENRRRVKAMAIDLSVLIGLFFLTFYVIAPIAAKHAHPVAYERAHSLSSKLLPHAHDATTKASKAADAAEAKARRTRSASDETAAKRARANAHAKKHEEDKLNKELDAANSKLAPAGYLAVAAFFLVGALYLIVPSGLTGQTLGKRLQHVKVLRQDGSPLGWAGSIVRYGSLVGVTVALFFLVRLGPFGPILVLVAVTTWMRNSNHQGLHDRLAKTIVVGENNP